MYRIANDISKLKNNPSNYLGERNLYELARYIDRINVAHSFEDNILFSKYCQLYFSEKVDIDWVQIILNYCNGNSSVAFDLFFEVYEDFFTDDSQIDTRLILHKALYYAFIEIRHSQDNNARLLADLCHNIPLKLNSVLQDRIIHKYDAILESIIEQYWNDEFAISFFVNNFPEIKGCFRQVWKSPTSTTIISRGSAELIQDDEILVKEFFAIRAKSIKIKSQC
ncbi:hypothetical protein AP75_02030 [Kaistella haifensis DSM 19056]|uniref:Uncharacterized protein n=2 Tax=Kaistella haifensis DSM 19056 TaxID=1450526 RepID=A0A246BC91_9FLAO|nr:hypothetical protein [Kaistella haifensis]OWK99290.1 hypothetical protein AP75_02030 [Kaistella haifensis DSM 19056]